MFNLFLAISTLSFAKDKFSSFIFFNTLFNPFSAPRTLLPLRLRSQLPICFRRPAQGAPGGMRAASPLPTQGRRQWGMLVGCGRSSTASRKDWTPAGRFRQGTASPGGQRHRPQAAPAPRAPPLTPRPGGLVAPSGSPRGPKASSCLGSLLAARSRRPGDGPQPRHRAKFRRRKCAPGQRAARRARLGSLLG